LPVNGIHSSEAESPFKLHKRRQLFIGAHNETLFVAIRVCNPECRVQAAFVAARAAHPIG
jgi:hypothetical protein